MKRFISLTVSLVLIGNASGAIHIVTKPQHQLDLVQLESLMRNINNENTYQFRPEEGDIEQETIPQGVPDPHPHEGESLINAAAELLRIIEVERAYLEALRNVSGEE